MGLNPEKGAVVDADLKVYGVQNLRIADSSVIPVIPGTLFRNSHLQSFSLFIETLFHYWATTSPRK